MNNKIIITLSLSLLMSGLFYSYARSAIMPTLALTPSYNGNMQIAVYGDPNAPIDLYYVTQAYSNAPFIGTIGYTNYSGYFSTTVNSSAYNIPFNGMVYVVVNGAASSQIQWPSYYNNNYYPNNYYPNNYYPYTYSQYNYYPNNYYQYQQPISLSQSNISMYYGQNNSITIYGSGNYYISNNSNPYVASAYLNGNNLNIYASNPGSTNITICQNNGSCAYLYITVINNNPQPMYYNNNYWMHPMNMFRRMNWHF